MKKISIIIALYNEEQNVEKLENNLRRIKADYGVDYEVIFSDGKSTDDTFSKISFPKISETSGRAKQMNVGVQYATGDVFLFIHADCEFEEDLIKKIQSLSDDIEFGCLKLRFKKTGNLYKDIWLRIIAFNSSLRVKMRGIAFGDQGIFISRELFDKVNGFKEIPIMEDYDLSIRLKEINVKPYLLDSVIETSPRRFLEYGIIKTMIKMQKLQYDFRHRRNIEEIDREYNTKGGRNHGKDQ